MLQTLHQRPFPTCQVAVIKNSVKQGNEHLRTLWSLEVNWYSTHRKQLNVVYENSKHTFPLPSNSILDTLARVGKARGRHFCCGPVITAKVRSSGTARAGTTEPPGTSRQRQKEESTTQGGIQGKRVLPFLKSGREKPLFC